MIKKCLFIILLPTSIVFAVLEKGQEFKAFDIKEEISQPKSPEEIEEQRERIKSTEKKVELLKDAKGAQEKKAKEMLDAYNKEKNKEKKNEFSAEYNKANKAAVDYTKMITAYNEKIEAAKKVVQEASRELSSIFIESAAKEDVKLEDLPNIAWAGMEKRDENTISQTTEAVKKVDVDAIKEQIKKIEAVDEKLNAIHDVRKQMQSVRELVAKELKEEEKGVTFSEQYKNNLDTLKDNIEKKLEELDILSVKTMVEQGSFFDRIKNAITSWFNRFRTPQPAQKVKEVKKELKIIKDTQKILAPLEKMTERIAALEKDASNFASDFDKQKGQSYEELVELQKRGSEIYKVLGDFDKTLKSQKKEINEIYKKVEEMKIFLDQASLLYKDNYNTLYEKLFDYFKSDAVFGGTPYKANEAYDILGLKPEASIEDIISAENKKKNALKDKMGKEKIEIVQQELKAIENAASLLQDPFLKEVYDVFLKDHTTITKLGLDDISKYSDRLATADLEIDEEVLEEINEIKSEFSKESPLYREAILHNRAQTESFSQRLENAEKVLGKTLNAIQEASKSVPVEAPIG
jgi:hypothetical protein